MGGHQASMGMSAYGGLRISSVLPCLWSDSTNGEREWEEASRVWAVV